ncbi:MAG TPA: hypothetical protein VF657_15900 [Actinoplanes sp.]
MRRRADQPGLADNGWLGWGDLVVGELYPRLAGGLKVARIGGDLGQFVGKPGHLLAGGDCGGFTGGGQVTDGRR